MNINKRLDSLKDYGHTLLRISLSLVFFWFSINQLITPDNWIGYLPEFLANTANPKIFIYTNAIFEIIFSTLLILGIFTRLAASLLGIHLLAISITLGWTAVAIRDYGLAFATLSIVLTGSDKLCLKK